MAHSLTAEVATESLSELTVGRQLDDQGFIVVLGFLKMPLDGFLIVVSEHLRTFARLQELLVVSLQSLDEAAVLLGAHLGQLRPNIKRINSRPRDTDWD